MPDHPKSISRLRREMRRFLLAPTLLCHHIPDSRNLVQIHVDWGRLPYIHFWKFYLRGALGLHRFLQGNSTLHLPNVKGLVSPLGTRAVHTKFHYNIVFSLKCQPKSFLPTKIAILSIASSNCDNFHHFPLEIELFRQDFESHGA